MKRKIAAVAAVAAIVGGVGAGISYADSPTLAPSAGPTAPSAGPTAPSAGPTRPGRAQHQARGLAARAIHGEVTLGGAKHRVVDFQRGSVTAVSATGITVKSADGFTETFRIDAATKVRGKGRLAAGDMRVGDRVRVVGVKDGKVVTAKRILDRS